MCIQGIVRGGVGRTALLRTTHGIRGGAIARACSQSAIDITVLGERPHASALEQQAIREHTSVRRVQYESSNTSNVSTPPPAEQRLQLITASDPLWSSPHTDGLPFPEPWWAFLWPGGYGTTQFVFDHQTNGGLVRSKRVLDMGSGCGSVALAAAAGGATSVLANDIDQWAGE
jgi:2-polyprenyl-3-methyl-5-hydroxy-6-metoxy-1,4-benzoquinol methylase